MSTWALGIEADACIASPDAFTAFAALFDDVLNLGPQLGPLHHDRGPARVTYWERGRSATARRRFRFERQRRGRS